MKTNYAFNNLKAIINSKTFIVFVLAVFIGTMMSLFAAQTPSYFDAFIEGIDFAEYQVMVPFSISLFMSVYMYKIFENNNLYIIRLKNKRQYLIELVKNIWLITTFSFLISMLFMIIGLNIIFGKYIIFQALSNGVLNIIYLLFYLTKIYLFMMVINTINVLLLKVLKQNIVIVLNFIMYAFYLNTLYDLSFVRSSIKDVPLRISQHLTILRYSSFNFEIISFSLYFVVLVLFSYILFKIVNHCIKEVGG